MGAGTSVGNQASSGRSEKISISVEDLCIDVVGWVVDRRKAEENEPLGIIYVYSPMRNFGIVSKFVDSLRGPEALKGINVNSNMPEDYQECQGNMVVDVDSLVATYNVTGL